MNRTERMGDNPEKQKSLGEGIGYFSTRGSAALLNMSDLIKNERPELFPDIQHYVAHQAVNNALYSLNAYLETRDSNIESDFANDTGHAVNSVRELDPELADIFDELYRNNKWSVTNQQVRDERYEAILQRLLPFGDKYNQVPLDVEYSELVDALEYPREKLLENSLRLNLSIGPIENDPELEVLANKHWDRNPPSFEEYVANARALYELLKAKGNFASTLSNHLFEEALIQSEQLLAARG